MFKTRHIPHGVVQRHRERINIIGDCCQNFKISFLEAVDLKVHVDYSAWWAIQHAADAISRIYDCQPRIRRDEKLSLIR